MNVITHNYQIYNKITQPIMKPALLSEQFIGSGQNHGSQSPSAINKLTLPLYSLESSPCPNKQDRPTNILENEQSSLSLKLKFNISSENLKCFISKQKGDKSRSLSTRYPKQSRSEVQLMSLKIDLTHQTSSKQTQKSHTERSSALNNRLPDCQNEDNLSAILSNQIISEIQKKGIRYDWKDQREKIDPPLNEEKEDEIDEIQELFNAFSEEKLFNAFSEEKKHKRQIANENFSTNQSFLTQKTYENESTHLQQRSILNFSNYDEAYSSYMTRSQHYQQSIYYQMYPSSQEGMGYGLKSMPSHLFPSNEFIIRPQGLGKDPRTTLMIKNIPNKYTIQFLSEQIDQDFGNYYDFLYLPYDTKSGANQGYGFINFTDLWAIKRFYEQFHGKKWRRFRSEKICNLTYARLQGINSLIEHFQNSKVLNHKEKKYQPIIKKLNQQIHNLIKEQQNAHGSSQREQK